MGSRGERLHSPQFTQHRIAVHACPFTEVSPRAVSPMFEPSRLAPDELQRRLQRHIDEHPASPLFTVLAELHLREGRLAEAMKLLAAGLAVHPLHPTARLLHARGCVMQRRYRDARATLTALMREMPACAAAVDLLEALKAIELEYPPLHLAADDEGYTPPPVDEQTTPSSRVEDVIPVPAHTAFSPRAFGAATRRKPLETAPGSATGPHLPTGAALPAELLEVAAPFAPASSAAAGDDSGRTAHGEGAAYSAAQQNAPAEDDGIDLERLAARLESARIPIMPDAAAEQVAPPDAAPQRPDRVNLQARPVTETLAAIYVQQGRIEEALAAYRVLAVRHPERIDEFARRIAELERRST